MNCFVKTKDLKVYSFGSSDQKGDERFMPINEEQKKFGMKLLN